MAEELGPNASAATVETAIAGAETVVLAPPTTTPGGDLHQSALGREIVDLDQAEAALAAARRVG